MKPNLRLQRKIMNVIKSVGGSVVWKMRVFLENETFIVPDNIAGNLVLVTGCGGGGGGMVQQWNPSNGASGAYVVGGSGGHYVERLPVLVNPGDSVPVIIGLGGAAISTNAFQVSLTPNDGLNSSFGSLVMRGGKGGGMGGGFLPERKSPIIPQTTSTSIEADNKGLWKAGSKVSSTVSASTYYVSGGAPGLFGDGGDSRVDTTGAVNLTAVSAAANTGAGGGSAVRYTSGTDAKVVTSGAGGSGRIIIEWQEYA